MPTFTLNLTNSTGSTWYYGIYQTYPSTVLDSTVWKVQGVPAGATDQIQWTADYGVSIIKLNASQTEIVGKQVVNGDLGKLYHVKTDGGVPSIQPNSIGSSKAPDIIALKNDTQPAEKVDMGFALSGDILAVQKDVLGAATSEFQVHPTYWVDLYSNIQVCIIPMLAIKMIA